MKENIIKAYGDEWRNRIFRGFLCFGFSEKDIHFDLILRKEGQRERYVVIISQKLYLLLGEVAHTSDDLLSVWEAAEKRSLPGKRSELLLSGVISLSGFHWLIASALQKEKRCGQRIKRGKKRIDDESRRVLPVQTVKYLGESHFHKNKGEYFLWVDLGAGRIRLAGKTPENLVQKLKDHLREVQSR